MRKVRVIAVVGVTMVALVVAGVAWWLIPDDGSPEQVTGSPETTASVVVEREGPRRVARAVVLRKDPSYGVCGKPPRGTFRPVRISMPGVTRGAPVLAVPRDANGVPGVPPVSTAGKTQFAFDAPGIHPGATQGNTILTAHTWPDGTAMGNRLLARLDEGNRLVLRNVKGRGLCYRVTERLEVSEVNPPVKRVYATEGKPQVVIIVCSGTRLGPGQWTHRTLWFASPIAD